MVVVVDDFQDLIHNIHQILYQNIVMKMELKEKSGDQVAVVEWVNLKKVN